MEAGARKHPCKLSRIPRLTARFPHTTIDGQARRESLYMLRFGRKGAEFLGVF